MDFDLFFLQEPVNPVDRLYEIVELVPDSEENGLIAMALEIAPAASDNRLCREVLKLPVREINNRLLPLWGRNPTYNTDPS